MPLSRLEQLLQHLEEDPGDPFNIYAVAMEYRKTDVQKATKFLLLLLHEHEDYLPTYYHLGKLKQEQGNVSAAKRVFSLGIEKAEKFGELKTLRELKSALMELEMED